MIAQAESRARQGDVRGVTSVLDLLRRSDIEFGQLRPDAISSAIAAVDLQLDAARRLRLVRGRWVLRAAPPRPYSDAISSPLGILRSIEQPLRDIKELAGSSQASLTLVRQQTKALVLLIATIIPPEECRSAHALIASAAQLADTAAQVRREAA